MHVVIRHSKGSAELIDLLSGDREQVGELFARIDGVVAFCLIRTDDGGASVGV